MRKRTALAVLVGGLVAAKLISGAQRAVETATRRPALGDVDFGSDAWERDLYAASGLYAPTDPAGLGLPPYDARSAIPGYAPNGSYAKDQFANDDWNDDGFAVDPFAIIAQDPAGLGLPPYDARSAIPGYAPNGSYAKDQFANDDWNDDGFAVDPFAIIAGDPAGLGRGGLRKLAKKAFRPLSQTLRKVAARPMKLAKRDVKSFVRGAKRAAIKNPVSALRRSAKIVKRDFTAPARLFRRGGGGGGDDAGYQTDEGGGAPNPYYRGPATDSTMAPDGVTTDDNGVVSANNAGAAPTGRAPGGDAPDSGMWTSPLVSEADPGGETPDQIIPETEAPSSSDALPPDRWGQDPLDEVFPDYRSAQTQIERVADGATAENFTIQPDRDEPQPAPIDYARDDGVPTGGMIRVNSLDWAALRADQPDADKEPAGFDDDAAPMEGMGDLCDLDGRRIVLGRPRDGVMAPPRIKTLQADKRGNVWVWNNSRLEQVGTIKNYGGVNRVRRLVTRPWNRRSREDIGPDQGPALDGLGCPHMDGLGRSFSWKNLTHRSKLHDRATKIARWTTPSGFLYANLKKKQPAWSRYRRIWGYSAPYVAIAGAAVATVYTGGAAAPALASAAASATKMEVSRQQANRAMKRADAQRDADMRVGSADAAEAAVIQDAAQPRDTPAPLSWLQPVSGSAPGELPGGDSADEYQGDGIVADFLDVADIN